MSETRKQTIIYLGPNDALSVARDVLHPSWDIVAPEPSPRDVMRYLDEAIAILDASMKIRFDRILLDRVPKLQVIATATTGADHIDSIALSERGIALFTLAGEKEVLSNLTPAAEHSWTLLMACARRLRSAVQHVLDGNWIREEFPGIMLKGKTLGIIGCGRIGAWMARYARAFDMNVIGFDPYVSPWPATIQRNELLTLLSRSDFVSLHVLMNPQNRKMLGETEFSAMKPGAVFINTSRGGLIDEHALLNGLLTGRIGAAGLDVLDGEPAIENHPLLEYARMHDNLIITPHIGGFSPDAVKVAVAHAAHRIAAFLESGLERPSAANL